MKWLILVLALAALIAIWAWEYPRSDIWIEE
jgi:hypothetical protein